MSVMGLIGIIGPYHDVDISLSAGSTYTDAQVDGKPRRPSPGKQLGSMW
jgi:hypothetical protein